MTNKLILSVERQLNDIHRYVHNSTRLKFFCIDVSTNLICLGGSTGSIYLFDRNSGELIKFISHKVQAIKLLKFSHDGKLLASADSNGHIVCWEMDQKHDQYKIFKEIDSYNGHQVTAICWSNMRHCLYVGDNKGLVMSFSIAYVGFVKSSPDIIRKSGDSVVQLDSLKNFLLISSTSKAMICFTDRGQFHNIGTKSRDGFYGACFVDKLSGEEVKIYAARPSSRLWEVDLSGQVKVTHQFKEQLKIHPTKITTLSRNILLPESNLEWNQSQGLNFPCLKPILSQYVLAWSVKSVYIFNPENGSVLCWNDQLKNIKCISCYENALYVLHEDSSVTELKLNSVKKCLQVMCSNELWVDVAKFACLHEENILADVEAYISIDFFDVLARLKDEQDKLEPDETLALFEEFVANFNAKYIELRAIIQERLNQVLLNEPTASSTDSGVEDGDDIKSNVSDAGISEGGSSRISLSRLAEINLESVMQKATNALVTKVVNSGFMKKALQEALQAEGVIIDNEDGRNKHHNNAANTHPVLKHAHSLPSSPRTKHKQLSHTSSNENLSSNTTKFIEKISPKKSNSVPSLPYETVNTALNFTDDVVIYRGRGNKKGKPKKKKKNKVITLDHGKEDVVQNVAQPSTFGNVDKELLQEKPPTDEVTTVENLVHVESGILDNNPIHESKDESEIGIQQKFIPEMNVEMTEKAYQIINKLANITVATRNKFRDPIILYNPKAIHDILITWSNELQKLCIEFQEEFMNNISKYIISNLNPTILIFIEEKSRHLLFTNLGAAFGEIADVAMLCVESGIFPEGGFELKNHEVTLLNGTKTMQDLFNAAENEIMKLKNRNDENKKIEKNQADHAEQHCHFTEGFVTPRNSLQTDKIMKSMENQPVNELLYDKKSLSTIPSESDIGENICLFSYDKQELACHISICENPNSFLGQCDSCELDKCRACFVLRYFHVLDFARIRSLLSWKQGCRWWTWNACVVNLKRKEGCSDLSKSLDDGNLSSIRKAIQSTNNVQTLLANAARLYSKDENLFDDLLMNDLLSNWEVVMLYQNMTQVNEQMRTNFLTYSFENINKFHGDYLFSYCSLQNALLISPSSSDLFCKCHQPRAGSNTVQWEWSHLLDKLIALSIECFQNSPNINILAKFKELCLSRGYWFGFIELSCCIDDEDNLLSIILHLQDFHIFTRLLKEEKLKLSEKEWADLLTSVNDANDTICNCEPVDKFVPSMTLENIIKLAAQYTNARFVLSVMSMFKLKSSFSTDLFTSLLKAGELENRQDCLVTRLIEVASSQVWSDSKMLVHPQLEQVKQAELRGEEPVGFGPNDLINNEIVMNESDAIWGRSIKISDTNCVICRLPLCLKTVSTATAGLIVFQCGHTFHKICVPENACLQCYHDTFNTLL